jgi:predicted site-specific integrase-resolvase
MMTADEYKNALILLEWNHDQAAQALGIGRRTSQRYAKEGAPKFIALALGTFTKTKEAA